MENKLLKKLQLKPGNTLRVMNGPPGLATILGDIPRNIELSEKGPGPFHVLLLFARDSAELEASMKKTVGQLGPDTVVWVAYPKKDSGLPTDLNLMAPWQQLQIHGLGPVASVAVDDTWTAIRLRRIDQIKASGLCNDDIQKGPYGAFIDVAGRVVKAPPDLQALLDLQPEADAFFERLSFTNKKEYVLWLLTAKQEKTRLARLDKALEKLLQGKKNPSEK